MRGKSAAAAPFSGATVQLAGSSGYFICFLQLFGGEKQQKPLRPVTRAAACGPVAASGDHAGLPANRPRRFPPPGHKLLLLPRDIVGRILFTSTHKRGQSQQTFFYSSFFLFLLLFGGEKQQKPLRPEHVTYQSATPPPTLSPPCLQPLLRPRDTVGDFRQPKNFASKIWFIL